MRLDPSSPHYSEKGFWKTLRRLAGKLGRPALHTALTLYYCARDPKTPTKARVCILAALGYLIFPFDGIPDFTPIVGLSDDLGVMLLAVGSVGIALRREHRESAAEKIRHWFGAGTAPGDTSL